jgi:RNA polymerase sigma-70 factor (ECF subfamily)
MKDMTGSDPTEQWREVFRSVAPGMILFARQYIRCIDDAEDAVQNAFVRFWRKRTGYRAEDRSLLFCMVRAAALDINRGAARRREREMEATRRQELEAPLFDVRASSSNGDLETAISQLPPEQREVLVLKIWNALTFAEIANVLVIPQNTASSRYRYALERLRHEIAPQPANHTTT